MDRAMLSRHLAQAERHVSEGEHVRHQRGIIAALERDGHDAAQARELLKEFEEALAMHTDGRDRLVKELAAASD